MTLDGAMWLVLVLGSLALSAVFSGIEIGCYSLNRVRLDLRAMQTPPDRSARVMRDELSRPDRILATLLIANNIAHYFLAMGATNALAGAGLSDRAVLIVSNLTLTPLIFVFGEALPKEIFRIEADRLAYPFAFALRVLRVALTVTGVLPAVGVITRSFERVTGLPPQRLADARQRIAQLLKEGAVAGMLSESQVTLLDRAMVFRAVTVGDEMIAWAKVRSLPLDSSRNIVRRLIGESVHARLPVTDRTGRVVGIVRQLDLHLRPEAPLQALLRAPVRLRRTNSVREALVELRRSDSKLGVVEDAAGRPVGIVTLKDLVEPLTGELADL